MKPIRFAVALALLAGCSGANFDVASPLVDGDAAPGDETASTADDSGEPDADVDPADAKPETAAETAPVTDAGPDMAPAPDTLVPDTAPAPDTAAAPDTATAPDTAPPPPIDAGPTFAVTDVVASNLKVSTSCKFTIVGTGLPASLFVTLPNCLSYAGVTTSGSSTSQSFSCTPWASGGSYVNVYDAPGHVAFTKLITFVL
jgi:hypothetical protein